MISFIIFYTIIAIILSFGVFYLVISAFLDDWKLSKDIIIFEKTINRKDKINILNNRILNRMSFEKNDVKLEILKKINNSDYLLTIVNDKYFMNAIGNWINFINVEDLNPKTIQLNTRLIEQKYDFLIDKYIKDNYGYYV